MPADQPKERRRGSGSALWEAGQPITCRRERRLPTIDEINAAAPDVPVYVAPL